jgi:hypothetical protein
LEALSNFSAQSYGVFEVFICRKHVSSTKNEEKCIKKSAGFSPQKISEVN